MIARDILITGGSGFIGRHLVTRLLKQKCNLYLLQRPGSQLPSVVEDAVTRVNCDDWSKDGISAVLPNKNFATILHLASYGVNPKHRELRSISNINIVLPATLVELAHDWGANIVMLGSCSEYGSVEQGKKIDENSPLETGKLYGSSKAAGTLYACAVAEHLKVHMKVLRLFNVYGPGEAQHRLLPTLIRHLKNNERTPLSAGSQVRDFVYVKDIVDAIICAAELPQDIATVNYADIWNICSGQPYTVRQFAEIVAKQLDKHISLLGFSDLGMRPDEIPWVVGNPDKIYQAAGWRAQYSLSAGITDILSEMKGNINVN